MQKLDENEKIKRRKKTICILWVSVNNWGKRYSTSFQNDNLQRESLRISFLNGSFAALKG